MFASTLRAAAAVALATTLAGMAGQVQAGYQEGVDMLVARDYARAKAEFEADRANPRSVYQLAVMARDGLGEPRDAVRAAGLMKEAVQLGDPSAKLAYAYMLGNGTGVDGNGPGAVRLLEQLTAAGHLEGTVVLGRAVRYGWWGHAKDPTQAAELFRKAADGGDPTGRLMYAEALLAGDGVAKDAERGLALLREGVERNHVPSQVEYARMLTYGEGVPKDAAAGLELYRKAAVRADRTAQFGIGLALLYGQGGARDEKTAARWIDAAARQGYAPAQLQLADMFRTGNGVPQLSGEAYFWYSVAARSTTASIAERANAQRAVMAPGMPSTQLASLAARTSNFAPQPGLKPRATPLQPPARGDRVELGDTTIRVPAPAGYMNGWEVLQRMQQTYPNDSDLAVLMVMHHAEDHARTRMGLPGRLRTFEVSQHADDSIRVTPTLFADMKKAARRGFEATGAGRQRRLDSTLRDDDDSYAVLRAAVQDPTLLDAVSFVRVREKVLMIIYFGFDAEQREQLTELVRTHTEEILAANRGGLFSGR